MTAVPDRRRPVPSVDVVIVGGGMIGVTTAAFCAEAGLSVLLLERDGLAAAASGRNQGLVIGPHPAPMAELASRGLEHYLRLHDESGGVFAFDREPHGCLVVSGPAQPGRSHVSTDSGVPGTSDVPGEGTGSGVPGTSDVPGAGGVHGEAGQAILGRDEVVAIEPLLAPEAVGSAVLFEDARRIDPAAAVGAWAERARRAGAELRVGCDVKELRYQGDRVIGVLSDDGPIAAETVVVAAGPWSSRVARGASFDVPVVGVRGWLVVTRPAPFRLRHVIEEAGWEGAKSELATPTVADLAAAAGAFASTSPSSAAVPSAPPAVAALLQQDHRGRLLLGASLQVDPAEDPLPDRRAPALVAARAAELVPAVAALEVAEIRTCRRPATPDGLPLHGPVPGVAGLVLACGHGSKGITWGPGSGEAVARGITTGRWDERLLPGRPGARER